MHYSEKYRSGLLYDHVDIAARAKFTGFESEFEVVMTRLKQFMEILQKWSSES